MGWKAMVAAGGDNSLRAAMSDAVHDDCTDLDEARQGQQAAFERIYDRHAAVMLSLCRRKVLAGSLDDAEDAMQETFFRAFRKLDEVHDCRGLRSWMYRIARLVCSERRRSETRRHHHEEVAMEQARRFMIDSTTNTARTGAENDGSLAAAMPPATAVQQEQLRRLSAAIDRLADDERLAIHLYYLDADPVRAAQSALGIGRSAFYKLLTRARESLAIQMREAVQS